MSYLQLREPSVSQSWTRRHSRRETGGSRQLPAACNLMVSRPLTLGLSASRCVGAGAERDVSKCRQLALTQTEKRSKTGALRRALQRCIRECVTKYRRLAPPYHCRAQTIVASQPSDQLPRRTSRTPPKTRQIRLLRQSDAGDTHPTHPTPPKPCLIGRKPEELEASER